jgi:hypothetical protein
LGDDEVVYVEEFGDAGQRGFTVAVGDVAPGLEDGFLCVWPGNDGAGFVFAVDSDGGGEC